MKCLTRINMEPYDHRTLDTTLQPQIPLILQGQWGGTSAQHPWACKLQWRRNRRRRSNTWSSTTLPPAYTAASNASCRSLLWTFTPLSRSFQTFPSCPPLTELSPLRIAIIINNKVKHNKRVKCTVQVLYFSCIQVSVSLRSVLLHQCDLAFISSKQWLTLAAFISMLEGQLIPLDLRYIIPKADLPWRWNNSL